MFHIWILHSTGRNMANISGARLRSESQSSSWIITRKFKYFHLCLVVSWALKWCPCLVSFEIQQILSTMNNKMSSHLLFYRCEMRESFHFMLDFMKREDEHHRLRVCILICYRFISTHQKTYEYISNIIFK